ncbi:MAG: PIN domain-containing protein [Acidobacteria bacterium]|nr:PIN domain-containing protein [Acidobacteriota bacterium]
MISFDTNLAVYAANSSMARHAVARRFLESLATRDDVVVCKLMLVELYLKLRNPRIFPKPLDAPLAAAWRDRFRDHRNWLLVDSAPVMPEVWRLAAGKDFAFRRIVGARLAFTLRHHGVTEFAASNPQDYEGFGFVRVWNPLESPGPR